MTIKKKLYLAYGILGLIGAISTAVGIVSIHRLAIAIEDLSGRSEDATYDAGQIDTITSDMQAEQRGMVMRRFSHEDALSDGLIKDNLASVASLHKFVELYRPLVAHTEADAKVSIIDENLAILDRLNRPYWNRFVRITWMRPFTCSIRVWPTPRTRRARRVPICWCCSRSSPIRAAGRALPRRCGLTR